MQLIKCKVGSLVELFVEKCGIPNLTVNDVSGINRDKEFFEPSKQVGSDTSAYKVVPPRYFACNLMHVGRDVVLPLAWNHSLNRKIVSSAYFVFKLREEAPVLPEFFFMMMKSTEKDRYFWFNTDASVRDGMSWDDFCDVELELPAIHIQEKYVAVYSALMDNQNLFNRELDKFMTCCFATIERFRDLYELHKIGDFIEARNEKNKDGLIQLEQGINISKQFITPQRSNSNLFGRKIVRKGQFAYCTQLNNENVAIAYRDGEDCVVSSVYDVFEIVKPEELHHDYLMLWLIRPEFGRFVYWASEGSAYEFLDYDNIANYCIPIPPFLIQESIGRIYRSYISRGYYYTTLKKLINDVCPVLVRGAIQEAQYPA